MKFRTALVLALALLAAVHVRADDAADCSKETAALKMATAAEKECRESLAGMVSKQALADAEAAAAKATAAAKAALSKAEAELKALQKKAADEAAAAAKKLGALEKEVARVKASYKTADSEALSLRRRVEEAEAAVSAMRGAWLPHWAQERAAQGAEVAAAAAAAAQAAYATHAAPLVAHYGALARAKFNQASAAASAALKQRGIEVPSGVSAAVATAKARVHAAAGSDAALKARAAAASAVAAGRRHMATVVAELEGLLVQVASMYPALAPLAQKPVSTAAVCAFLAAPVAAIGLPALAARMGRGRRSAGPTSSGTSSQQRKQHKNNKNKGGKKK